MAVSRFKQHKRFHGAEVHTSAMSDIMFFLMLFFLIISTLVNSSAIKLQLPKAQSTQSVNKQKIILAVNAEGSYFLNDIAIPPTALEAELQKITATSTDKAVVVRMDESLTIQDLVGVLEIGNKLQIKMVLATKSPR